MSLDAIKKSILSDAESKASAIDAEAESEVRLILKEAEDRSVALIKKAEHDAKAESDRLAKEVQAGAETEANSLMLEAKGAAIERALNKVTEQAERTLSRDYSKKLFDNGLKQFKVVSNSDAVIKTGKRNAAMFKNSKYNVEYADIDGFMFYTEDRKIALNATVPSMVDKEKDVARKFISRELFSEGGSRSKPKKTAKAAVPKKEKHAKKQKGKRKKG